MMNIVNLGEKVRALSFLAMLFVVVIHSKTTLTIANPSAWNLLCQNLLGLFLSSWAVPFFFVVSGFFFGKRIDDLSAMSGYVNLLKKKCVTLLFPYLLWVTIVTIMSMPTIVLSNIVHHRDLMCNTFLSSHSFIRCFFDFLGLEGAPAGNVPLWFLRTLMIIFLISPIFKLCKGLNKWVEISMAILLACANYHFSVPIINLMVGTVGFFWFGVALNKFQIETLGYRKSIMVVSALGIILYGYLRRYDLICNAVISYCWDFLPLLLIAFIWCLYDSLFSRFNTKTPAFFRWTFWVYCIHNGIVDIIQIVGFQIFGKSDIVALILFIINPLLVISACLYAAYICSRKLPRTFKILTGGRV